VVYVSGAVVTPGTFVLTPGARIADAITAAGGLRADADGALVNQAEHLFDGAQVHVPVAGVVGAAPAPRAGLSGLLPTPTPESRAAAVALAAGDLIELNTATQAELETLPGIGASKAQAIIANRPYANVDDLERVPGIGPATVNRLRPLVTVQP
jgi:competence protein ComEA